MLQRMASIAILVLGLAACGFELRDEVALPESLSASRRHAGRVRAARARPLGGARARRRGRRRRGAGRRGVVRIPVDAMATEPLSVSDAARVQEFLIRYRVELEVVDAAARVLLPLTPIELTRDYSYDETQALGAAAEEELLRKELRREMAQQVLRRHRAARRRRRSARRPSGSSRTPHASAPTEPTVALSLPQFERHLAGGELRPVYLIAGDEHLVVLEAADALRAKARALGLQRARSARSGRVGLQVARARAERARDVAVREPARGRPEDPDRQAGQGRAGGDRGMVRVAAARRDPADHREDVVEVARDVVVRARSSTRARS